MSVIAQIIIAVLNLAAVVVNWGYDRWKKAHKYGMEKVKGIKK